MNIEKLREEIDRDIEDVWEKVVNPFINEYGILDEIENDYAMFYSWMILNTNIDKLDEKIEQFKEST